MIRILFTTILFFLSSNLLASTYLVCTNIDEKRDLFTVKLDKKKIFLNINNEGFEEWSEDINKINSEEINLFKETFKPTADWTCEQEFKRINGKLRFDCDEWNKPREENEDLKLWNPMENIVNSLIEKLPLSSKNYKFDRVSGYAEYISTVHSVEWNFKFKRAYNAKKEFRTEYLCEVKDKPLF